MNAPWLTSSVKLSFEVKLYSRPCSSPPRGCRVVSVGKQEDVSHSLVIGEYREQRIQRSLRETENPNVLGWAAKRRLRMVDFPEPEGPQITIGRCFCAARLVSKWAHTIHRYRAVRGKVPEGAMTMADEQRCWSANLPPVRNRFQGLYMDDGRTWII